MPQKISAQVGEDVEIQCRGPEDGKVLVLEWIQSDLGPDGYLYLYRDGSVMDNHQHPFFKNRVELRDPEMKKGDLSVILKKVTFNDGGVFKCLSLFETFKEERREDSQEFNLTVTEAETSEGGATEEEGGVKMEIVGIVFGVVLVLLFCVLVFFLIHQCKKQKKTKNIIVKSPEPGDENPEESDTESSTNRDNRNHAFAYVKHGSLPRKESKAFLLEHV